MAEINELLKAHTLKAEREFLEMKAQHEAEARRDEERLAAAREAIEAERKQQEEEKKQQEDEMVRVCEVLLPC